MPDESNILVDSDKSVLVSVQQLKYLQQQSLFRSNLHEEATLVQKLYKLPYPKFTILHSLLPELASEQHFHKIDFQHDGDHLLITDGSLLSNSEAETTVQHVINLSLIQTKHLSQYRMHLLRLIQQVVVCVVSLTYRFQLR